MKTNMENNIIKKIDLDARVDYDTARCLMLMGMPQGKKVDDGTMVNKAGETVVLYEKREQPFYVTHYRSNAIHEFVEELSIGHIHIADKMCYAPTVREALEFLNEKLMEDIDDYSIMDGYDEVDFEMARVLCYLGMPQGRVLSEWKPTKAQLHRYGEPFYVTIYKTKTFRKLVDLNKGHDRDADAMCYAPTVNTALRWIESMLHND